MRSRSSIVLVVALVLPSAALGLGCGGAAKEAAHPSSAGSYGDRATQAVSDDGEAVSYETRPRPAKAAAASAPASAPAPGGAPPPAPPPAPRPDGKTEATTREAVQNRDLVIYTARYTMAVHQVEEGLSAVERIARDNDGYLGLKRDREITVRVPRERFDVALAAIDRIGDVLHRDVEAQDVTDEHVDLEVRIKNARTMQQRLADLLTKASVKEALEIEIELHRVTEELERLEGRMKVLKAKIAFSTITVSFQPRGVTIETARVRLPFPWLGELNLPSLLSLSEEK